MQSIFVSYSHRDRRALIDLKAYLGVLRENVRLSVWDDTSLKVGDRWQAEIERAIDESTAAILLISPDFLASDFIMLQELPRLLARHDGGRLVCIYLRRSPVELAKIKYTHSSGQERSARLSEFQGIIGPDKPFSEIRRPARDKALVGLVELVARFVGTDVDPADAEVEAKDLQAEQEERENAGKLAEVDRVPLVVTLKIPGASFPPEAEVRMVRRIAALLELPESDIRVVGRRAGSVLLDLELPGQAAFELWELAQTGALAGHDGCEAWEFSPQSGGGGPVLRARAQEAAAGSIALTTGQILELARIDALGLLDEGDHDTFERAFYSMPPTVRARIRTEQTLTAGVAHELAPDVAPPPDLKARVLAAVRSAARQTTTSMRLGRTGPDLVRPGKRSVSPLWRAACLGLFSATCVLGLMVARGRMPPSIDQATARLLLSADAQSVPLIAAGPGLRGRVIRTETRALVVVSASDRTALAGAQVVFIDATGKATPAGGLDRELVDGVLALELPASMAADLAQGHLEVRDAEGRVLLHT